MMTGRGHESADLVTDSKHAFRYFSVIVGEKEKRKKES